MIVNTSLENQFLVAMPSMRDPRFANSVSLVCQHNQEGATALVINKPATQSLREVFMQMNLATEHLTHPDQLILSGGPVQPEMGFVLHPEKGQWEATLSISAHLHLTSSADILEAISRDAGPAQYLFLLGYAGWAEGQIETELKENAWFHCPADNEIIFSSSPEKIAQRAINSAGIDLTRISQHTGNA